MASNRECAREALGRLSEDEIEEILTFIREIERRRDRSAFLDRLAADPAFRVPVLKQPAFRSITPIIVTGRAASEVLVEDRR